MIDSELRSYEITKLDDTLDSNRQIWKSLGIKQSDTAFFFPAPNALIPLKFAKFMNKRKVTFADAGEINVSTLLSLAAELKLTNVIVKLASPNGKFPITDSFFDLVYSDFGFSTFASDNKIDVDLLTKEYVRILKPGGRIAAVDENGAPVMYPCPPEIQAIRAKFDSPKADRLIMGRRIYGAFKSCGLKDIRLHGYSRFLTSDDDELFQSEITRRIAALDPKNLESYPLPKGSLSAQEIEKYKNWLKSQRTSESFMIQFNMILGVALK